MTRVLLLGGTGFIGSASAKELRTAGYEVVTVGRSTEADLQADITIDLPRLLAHAAADVVVNLAGAGLASGTVDERTMAMVNTELPQLLATHLGGTRLIHAASSTEPADSSTHYESAYSRTKHEGSLALTEAAAQGQPITFLRIYNVYGPGQPSPRFVAHAIRTLQAGQELRLNFPDRVRDFVFLDDVSANIVAAIDTRMGLLEVGTGTGLSLFDVAHRIAAAVGADPALVRRPDSALLDPHPSTFSPVRYGTLGLCRTSFDEGLDRMLEGM